MRQITHVKVKWYPDVVLATSLYSKMFGIIKSKSDWLCTDSMHTFYLNSMTVTMYVIRILLILAYFLLQQCCLCFIFHFVNFIFYTHVVPLLIATRATCMVVPISDNPKKS